MSEKSTSLTHSGHLLIIAILVVLLFQPVISVRANVVMNYFKASIQTAGIFLEWETSSESNNIGFYILRSTKLDQDYSRIDVFFLSDSVSGEGVYYSYLDDQVNPGTIYYYKLEVIDLDGSKDYYGPVAAGILAQTPTSTVTATSSSTPTRILYSLTRTPTPIGGITSIPTKSLTPTRTEIINIQITQTITPTPTITETVSDVPTATPTLEPLPTIELLFPAPTATVTEFPTPSPQITSTIQSPLFISQSKPLSSRYLFLLGILLLLWISLLIFLVLFLRKLFQSVREVEDGD